MYMRGSDPEKNRMVKHLIDPRVACMMLLPLSLSACAASPANPPTTAPSPTQVKLTDVVALTGLTSENRTANLTDKLTRPQAAQTMYFGEIDEYADNADEDDPPIAALPIIALRNDKDWLAVPLAGEGLADAGWKYVGSGPAPREIWGALDTVAGDSQANFVLAHSTDGGASFQLTTFHKPCKLAEFFDFAMDRDGHGRASVSLDTDCGKYKAGIYHYQTTDDGKTWNLTPKYEPDAMIRADPVPDDEQPEQPEMKHRTASKAPGGIAARLSAARFQQRAFVPAK
jgi:hypothetical protein